MILSVISNSNWKNIKNKLFCQVTTLQFTSIVQWKLAHPYLKWSFAPIFRPETAWSEHVLAVGPIKCLSLQILLIKCPTFYSLGVDFFNTFTAIDEIFLEYIKMDLTFWNQIFQRILKKTFWDI
jgi:hypothetical protein